jgi:hypothetical protein
VLSRTRSSAIELQPSFAPGSDATDAQRPSAPLDSTPTYTCSTCGHVLRVAGLGRHRVYFELTDERRDDPVMNRQCPGCEQRLPTK